MAQQKRRYEEVEGDTAAEGEVPVHTFDPDGDAILVVKGPRDSSCRLRVSTKVLSLNSPVLKTLFSDKLPDGQGSFDSVAPSDIHLDEDNPDGLVQLCRILHNDPRPIGKADEAGAALLSCIICSKKYQCFDRVELSLYGSMLSITRDILSPSKQEDLFPLLVAAYLLRNEYSFARASSALTLCSNHLSIHLLSRSTHACHVPEALFGKYAQASRHICLLTEKARLLQLRDLNSTTHLSILRNYLAPFHKITLFRFWSEEDDPVLDGEPYNLSKAIASIYIPAPETTVGNLWEQVQNLTKVLRPWHQKLASSADRPQWFAESSADILRSICRLEESSLMSPFLITSGKRNIYAVYGLRFISLIRQQDVTGLGPLQDCHYEKMALTRLAPSPEGTEQASAQANAI